MQKDDIRVNENLSSLSKKLSKVNDPRLIEEFFRCILTPAECADIAARWALVNALDKKVPQRLIASDLGISLCKITRGSRELKKKDSAFRKMLDLAE